VKVAEGVGEKASVRITAHGLHIHVRKASLFDVFGQHGKVALTEVVLRRFAGAEVPFELACLQIQLRELIVGAARRYQTVPSHAGHTVVFAAFVRLVYRG